MPDENLRASDADRDRVADRLREALAEGRISAEEHDERIDRLFRAKTYGELVPLTADLPEQSGGRPRPSAVGGPVTEVPPQAAIFGGARVRPVGRVRGRLTGFAMFGGVTIDLRNAEIDADGVAVSVVALFGGGTVVVPMDAQVKVHGVPVFGGVNHPSAPAEPGGPTVTVRAVALFGGVEIKRRGSSRKASNP